MTKALAAGMRIRTAGAVTTFDLSRERIGEGGKDGCAGGQATLSVLYP